MGEAGTPVGNYVKTKSKQQTDLGKKIYWIQNYSHEPQSD